MTTNMFSMYFTSAAGAENTELRSILLLVNKCYGTTAIGVCLFTMGALPNCPLMVCQFDAGDAKVIASLTLGSAAS